MRKIVKMNFALLVMGIAGIGQLAAMNTVTTIAEDKVVLLSEEIRELGTNVVADKSNVGKPFFRTKDNIVSINLLNLDTNPVEVKVFDQYDRVLFTQIITGDNSVGRAFDFSNVENGVYTIVVKDNGNKYVKRIEKL